MAFYNTGPLRQSNGKALGKADKEPLKFILSGLESPERLPIILNSMVDHAPSEIKADTDIVRDALKKNSKRHALLSPLNTIGDSHVATSTTWRSFMMVNNYIKQHCPVDSVLAEETIILNATE